MGGVGTAYTKGTISLKCLATTTSGNQQLMYNDTNSLLEKGWDGEQQCENQKSETG